MLQNFGGELELVIIMGCTNAVGAFNPPLAISRGRNVVWNLQMVLQKRSLVTMSDCRWMNEKWLHELTVSLSGTIVAGPCLLLLDGYG